jgi:LysM repeat protein
MAFNTTIDKATKISIDLGGIVNAQNRAIAQVQTERRSEKEALFQKVVMEEGLSYDAQLDFRKQQIVDEKGQSNPDEGYLSELNKEIGNLRKLKRYEKVRESYNESYDELVSGEKSLIDHKDFLEESLDGITDPKQQESIRKQISSMRKQIFQEEQKTLNNRVRLAQADGTIGVLNETIDELTKRKVFAESNGNTAAASNWDVSITSLRKQKNQTQIQNNLHDMKFDMREEAYNTGSKLNALDDNIDSASTSAPVTIDGIEYGSEREFWQSTRDDYLAGKGKVSGFEDFFSEKSLEVQRKFDRLEDLNKYGFIPINALDSVARDYKQLGNREIFAPFANRLESSQVAALSYGVSKSAEAVKLSSIETLQAGAGADALNRLESRYGIDLTSERFDLKNKIIAKGGRLEGEGRSINVLKELGAETPEELVAGSEGPGSLLDSSQGIQPTDDGQVVESTKGTQSEFDVSGEVSRDTNESTDDNTENNDDSITSASGYSLDDYRRDYGKVQDNNDGNAETPAQYREITIRSGDTLGAIADRELGDYNRFQELADFNEIENPDKIQAGNTIRVPVNQR